MRWISDEKNYKSRLVEYSRSELEVLYHAFRIKDKNAFFDPRFQAKIWDGYHDFLSLNGECLTGMVSVAKELDWDLEEEVLASSPLDQHSLDFDLDFMLKIPGKDEELIPTDYQAESIYKVTGEGIRRGLFAHITAAGKSATYTAIIRAILGKLSDKRPLRALIIVPTQELLLQTVSVVSDMLQEEVGILGAQKYNIDPRIVVAHDYYLKANKTLSKKKDRKDLLADLAYSTDVLILDEAHTTGKTVRPFLRNCVNAYFRYAFSGSFFDVSDPAKAFSTLGFFGATITEVTDEQTLAAGRTAPPHFYFYEFPLVNVPVDYKQVGYTDGYAEFLVHNEGYNKFFADLVVKECVPGNPVLALVQRVDHIVEFRELLSQRNVSSEAYQGGISKKQRTTLRSGFAEGKFSVLVATQQTLGIGIDIPRIGTVVNLGGNKADDMSKQKYGRGLRATAGKEFIKVIEPYITGVSWLKDHSQRRLNTARDYYKTGKVMFVPFIGVPYEVPRLSDS